MAKDDLSSHVDEIINALDEKSDKKTNRDEIEKEFSKFMEYGVPVEQAKQTLIKKYGGDAVFTSSSQSSSGGRVLISELEPNQSSVKILGHVVAVNPKEISVKGEKRKILYGILGDESGTVSFTAWNDLEIEKGDVLEVSNAYTREYQGAIQLNLGDRVKVEKTEKDKLPDSAFKPNEMKVKDLRSSVGHVEVTARILNVDEREVTVDGNKKKVFSGVIADETGKAQFTSWHDFNLKKGDVIRVKGGYVKSWKGIPQLTFDSNASLDKVKKSEIPKGEISSVSMPLFELVEKKGALDVEVEGTVIDIRPGSGFILRCPECNRALRDGECSIHGQVKGEPDFRIKMIVDDGTGAVDSVLNRDLSEDILGLKLEDVKDKNNDELMDKIRDKLFGHRISLKGNALGDKFGTTLIPKDVKIVDWDLEKEAENIINDLEDL